VAAISAAAIATTAAAIATTAAMAINLIQYRLQLLE
jgi:hypothetical protein